MIVYSQTPEDLLSAAYRELDFVNGKLLDATSEPADGGEDDWINNGEWLALARKVGVEKILFVDNNPVVVFTRSISNDGSSLRELFNSIWCMARPQLLFLACPGELAVLDLTKPPVKPHEDLSDQGRLLDVARNAAEVQSVLQIYSRSRIETGRLFEDRRFDTTTHRADEALIRDLKTVREELINAELMHEYAHALIGRCLFVRYLEDRKILTRDYFEEVASTRSEWQTILNAESPRPDYNPVMEHLLFPKILSDKEFTYAFFNRLHEDFNGDIFPLDASEKRRVEQHHLNLLHGFLRGDIGPQQNLFFFAYKFDVIPIELISSIYEEFYNTKAGEDNNHGSHYTAPALVEFVLSQVLSADRMRACPRILDPACGSGIFLVGAFRRIIRYHLLLQKGQPLDRSQLLRILRGQICGIEINPEAIRVAAFSLYLAFLDYQDPPDIRKNKRLPNLKYDSSADKDSEYQFDILIAANSFRVGANLLDPDVQHRFTSPCADIIVGNPPWGYPGRNDVTGLQNANEAIKWCAERQLPVGDKELSQAFIYKALDFLREGGCAGLLLSTGVFFKAHENSHSFRQKWLSSSTILQVVNFAHVREVFFSGPKRGADAIAPFASVVFKKGRVTNNDHMIEYWSAKKTPIVEKLQAVVLSRPDRKLLPQTSVYMDDVLWKVYWWGSHRDEALLQKLRLETPLKEYPGLIMVSGSGFKGGNEVDADWLQDYRELPVAEFKRYGSLDFNKCLNVPRRVARNREKAREIYEGLRLLLKQGPTQAGGHNGQIIARLEEAPFCFRHSIYGFRFSKNVTWQAKIVLGILWSSLARYYFFLTTSSWGTWHHTISLEEVRRFPVRLPDDDLRSRIIKIVDELREGPEQLGGLFSDTAQREYREDKQALERALDEAIFDLYGLTEAERDLVRDLCSDGLDLFYRHVASKAVEPIDGLHDTAEVGRLEDLPAQYNRRVALEPYLYAFLSSWNTYVEPNGEFCWQIVRPAKNIPLLAVVFTAQTKDTSLPTPSTLNAIEWGEVLKKMNASSTQTFHADLIYIDGLARIVSGADIVIIKRNEHRFWTPSVAREDAEATMLDAMRVHELLGGTKR